jgi:hypothetical protein
MLTLRRNECDDDFIIMRDGRKIGRLYKLTHGPSVNGWYWSVFEVHPKQPGVDYHGVAPTLDDAKAWFRQALETLR